MPTVKKQIVRKRRVTRSKNVVNRIAPIHFEEDEGISINLYGKSGTGKTTLCSTFPGPILMLICSALKKPGELRSIDTAANRKRIKTVVLEKSGELKDIIEHVTETGKYNTVALDNATGLQDLILKEILGLEELPAQGSWGMAKQQEWGQVALQMKESLRALLNLDCNRVIIAQERAFNTDDDNDLLMPYVASALSPSVTGWLNPACDYVCQTFIQQKMVVKKIRVGKKVVEKISRTKGVDYCLRTAPDATFTTKFRIPKGGSLPEYIVDPSYDKIKENGGSKRIISDNP